MSDVHIYKGPLWRSTGHLDNRIHIKNSAQETPLSHLSAHSRNIQMSWPFSRMGAIRRLCNNREDKTRAQEQFYSRLAQYHSSHPALGTCTQPPVKSSRSVCLSREKSWIVIPYNSVWARARVSRALSTRHAEFHHLFDAVPSIARYLHVGISWSNPCRHLMHTLYSAPEDGQEG